MYYNPIFTNIFVSLLSRFIFRDHSKMNILLTNDDGISSKGILALEKILGNDHNTYLVAPQRERSATSMALNIFDKMRVEKINANHYIIDGYPVDCVNIGLHGNIFPKIDLVISGINRGVNMGNDVHYSGTVGAARHAAIHSYIAISASSGKRKLDDNYEAEAEVILKFIRDYFVKLKKGIVYNINFPIQYADYPGSLRATKLGIRTYFDTYHISNVEGSISEFFLGGSDLGQKLTSDSDFSAYDSGLISITPITLETTSFSDLEEIKNW
jgi:5'-nucleotidase